MKRQAILIGAPGGQNNTKYLPGVVQDLNNVKHFLKSDQGGAWYDNEIWVLPNPSFQYLMQIVRSVNVDYNLIYFSGHGYTNNLNNRIICLKDEHIEDKKLFNNSHRQLILIDACRNYVNTGLSGIPDTQEHEQLYYFTGSPIREYFNQIVAKSPYGKTIVHGTQIGQYSQDSGNGGYFTRSILNIGNRISADNKLTYISIEGVLKYAPQVLRSFGNSQTPTIVYKAGNMSVPFGIGIPPHMRLPIKKYEQPHPQVATNNNAGTWLGLGLLAVVAIGVVSNRASSYERT